MNLFPIVTIFVTIFLGYFSKKSSFINNNLIPLQNLLIGLVVAGIEWLFTKDFKFAIAISGIMAGGIYDIGYNVKKIFKTDNVNEEK